MIIRESAKNPLFSGESSARQMPTPAFPHCLNLPPEKVAVQVYVFAARLAGLDIPGDWAEMPIVEKADLLEPLFPKVMAARPTSDQVEAVFREIRKIGYRNIETLDLISWPKDSTSLLEANDLQVIGSLESLDMHSWPLTLARAKARGQHFIGSSGFGAPGLETLEDVLQTAQNLNALGRAAAAQGLTFYVHNHTDEFNKRFLYNRGSGTMLLTSAWEIVAENTDPHFVSFEIDVFWAWLAFKPYGFENMLEFLRKHRSRIVLLHMKDVANNDAMADLGTGTIDWGQVVEAAGPQVAYYIYEYDFPVDPVKSADIGYEYLTCPKRK